MPDRHELIKNSSEEITLNTSSPFPAERKRLADLVANSQLEETMCSYPVRESGVFKAIATSLRFFDRDDYERVVLQRVGADVNLQKLLKNKLGNFASQLE